MAKTRIAPVHPGVYLKELSESVREVLELEGGVVIYKGQQGRTVEVDNEEPRSL